jgi:hypothetical protein
MPEVCGFLLFAATARKKLPPDMCSPGSGPVISPMVLNYRLQAAAYNAADAISW